MLGDKGVPDAPPLKSNPRGLVERESITTQIAAGVPLAVVSEVVGHSSTAFTAKVYGHLQPEHLRAAADAMQAAHGDATQ